jgi:hypothetical protein
MRAAGTYLRTLILSKSQLVDTVAAPTEKFVPFKATVTLTDAVAAATDTALTLAGALALDDTVPAVADSLELTVTYASFIYDGSVRHDGSETYRAGAVVVEVL